MAPASAAASRLAAAAGAVAIGCRSSNSRVTRKFRGGSDEKSEDGSVCRPHLAPRSENRLLLL